MDDQQLLRYSRHIMLPQLDIDGQEALLAARVLVVGAGGLGCPVAMYLAAAGVGHLTLVDDDAVELSNLQRQIGHHTPDIGQPKALSLAATLAALNPTVTVQPLVQRLDEAALDSLVPQCQVVVDATDNFSTRFAINRACVRHQVPLVSGAAIRLEGQLTVFDPRQPESPCYACLYREEGQEDLSCATNGVLAPLVGVIGSLQALEALKLLAGMGESLCGRLLLFDALTLECRELRLQRDPACSCCGGG